ncbi:hypothetical protein PA0159 [Candidatus Phytoplasma australiense]|uniref:DUF2963 domain-containing protein n=1 Tax=Phytoplasma australiense TaxID=59748 RepID=B1V962_PHYAS|nr:hypothetical protein PA0159 [Candidatus Phytoplasma australiense]
MDGKEICVGQNSFNHYYDTSTPRFVKPTPPNSNFIIDYAHYSEIYSLRQFDPSTKKLIKYIKFCEDGLISWIKQYNPKTDEIIKYTHYHFVGQKLERTTEHDPETYTTIREFFYGLDDKIVKKTSMTPKQENLFKPLSTNPTAKHVISTTTTTPKQASLLHYTTLNFNSLLDLLPNRSFFIPLFPTKEPISFLRLFFSFLFNYNIIPNQKLKKHIHSN